MSGVFDYSNLAKLLIDCLEKNLKLPMIESNSTGPQPDAPFVTYTVTSPYIAITSDVIEKEVFECVLSLTIHHSSKLAALSLSERLRKLFHQKGIRLDFSTKDVVIVSTTRTQSRDNFISYDYERLAGFDLRLRVKDSFVDDTIETIENIEI